MSLGAIAEFISGVAQEGRTLIVTNKRVRCALLGKTPAGRLPVERPICRRRYCPFREYSRDQRV